MRRVETFTDSGSAVKRMRRFFLFFFNWTFMKTFLSLAQPSPHVKSGVFAGQMKSIWRAMTGPVFDFQGDLHQQGGAMIAGPGKLSLCFYCVMICLSPSIMWNPIFFPTHTQAHKCIFAILIPTASTTCPSTGSSSSLESGRHWISANPRSFMCRETTSWIWEGFGFIYWVMSIFQITCSYWLYKLDIYIKPISFDWSHAWDARLLQQLKNKSVFSEEDHITNALMLGGCVILHSLHVHVCWSIIELISFSCFLVSCMFHVQLGINNDNNNNNNNNNTESHVFNCMRSFCKRTVKGVCWKSNPDTSYAGDSEILPLHRNVSTTGVPGPDNCASADTIARRHIRR